MPTFEIPDGPTSVDLQRPSDPNSTAPVEAAAVYNVTNKSSDSAGGKLDVNAIDPTRREWFTIEGDQERTFSAGETQTANVKIKIPADVAEGDYQFQLLAAWTGDTDNDVAKGPMTTAKLGGKPVPKPPSRWWIWLIVALVALIALGVGGYFVWKAMSEDNGDEEVIVNNTTTAEAKVPKFVDQKVDAIAPDAGGYRIIKNETPNTGRPPRTVYDQDPDPDTTLAPGSQVIVSYEPGTVVPQLPANATFTSATNALRSAGLEPGNFLCDPSSGSAGAQVGRITAYVPGPGTPVAAKQKIDMRAVQSGRCLSIVIPMTKITEIQRVSRLRLPSQ